MEMTVLSLKPCSCSAILECVAGVVSELRTLTLKMDGTQKQAVACGVFGGYHGNCTMCAYLCHSPDTKHHAISKQCVQFFQH